MRLWPSCMAKLGSQAGKSSSGEQSTIGPASADRSEGLPIENRQFPIENPVVVVESGDVRCFVLIFLGMLASQEVKHLGVNSAHTNFLIRIDPRYPDFPISISKCPILFDGI